MRLCVHHDHLRLRLVAWLSSVQCTMHWNRRSYVCHRWVKWVQASAITPLFDCRCCQF